MKQVLKSFLYLLPVFLSEKNFQIFASYVKLYVASFIHHRFKKTESEREKQTCILGYEISFFNYSSLINQFEEIFIYKSYRFKSSIKSPLIFDCGSNIGISILYFKIFHPGSCIVGFEPDPKNFRLLRKNVEQNKFSNIALHNCALGKQEGICKLFNSKADKSSLNASIYGNEQKLGFIMVPMKRLSGFIQEEIDFVKMDVEGAEEEIVEELQESGKFKNIRELVLEYHPKTGLSQQVFISGLKDAGLRIADERQIYEHTAERLLRFRKK